MPNQKSCTVGYQTNRLAARPLARLSTSMREGIGGWLRPLTLGWLALGASFLAAPLMVAAQPRAGDLDPSFVVGTGIKTSVSKLIALPDGKVLIAGDFTALGGVDQNHLARLQADGSLDPSFVNGLNGADIGIPSVVFQADGKALVNGCLQPTNMDPGESAREALAAFALDRLRLGFDAVEYAPGLRNQRIGPIGGGARADKRHEVEPRTGV